jgi:hypothetical protein
VQVKHGHLSATQVLHIVIRHMECLTLQLPALGRAVAAVERPA